MTYDLSKMTPEQLEAHRIKRRAYEKKRRDKDPERFRAQWRAAYYADLEKARKRDRDRLQKKREIAKIWRAKNPEKVKASNKRRHERMRLRKKPTLLIDGVIKYLRKALPAGLPTYARDDIISDVTLAVLEGKITLDQVPAKAKSFVTAHYRMFDEHKTVSIDAELAEDFTLLDVLASDELTPEEHLFGAMDE